jgi:primase-polymerase (primpol)-like protein
MPERVGPAHSHKPQKWLNYRHALEALDHEALVVAVIGADFLKYRELDEETWSRLATAVERITATRAKLSPARSVR